MRITELASALNLRLVSGKEGLSNNVTGGYVSDLLSDVMGNAREGQIWITLQTHQNIIAVASLKEIAGIIIVKGSKPEEETVVKSNSENIPVFVTGEDTFTTAGRLYELLKNG